MFVAAAGGLLLALTANVYAQSGGFNFGNIINALNSGSSSNRSWSDVETCALGQANDAINTCTNNAVPPGQQLQILQRCLQNNKAVAFRNFDNCLQQKSVQKASKCTTFGSPRTIQDTQKLKLPKQLQIYQCLESKTNQVSSQCRSGCEQKALNAAFGPGNAVKTCYDQISADQEQAFLSCLTALNQ